MVTDIIDKYAQDTETLGLAEHYPSIRRCFSQHGVESIIQSLELEGNPWCDELLQVFKKCSPASLKVVYEQYHCVLDLSFDDIIEQDLRLMSAFLKGDDVFEGIRALIVDKDNQPRWNPDSLVSVSEDKVKSYFYSQMRI